MRICEIIEKLIGFHPAIDDTHTVDVFKFGNPEQECTGIAVTTFASVNVIRRAASLGVNLIIVHEPLFFSNSDSTDWLKGNTIYEAKKLLMEEHGIVVWRDHDHIHGGRPDPDNHNMDLIYYGIMKTLGWENYLTGSPHKPLTYRIPVTTVRDLAKELIEKLHLNGARIIGNLDAQVETVFLCEHITGASHGRVSDNDCISKIERENYDVMLPLEIIDWTLSEYVRDALELGRTRALIEIGHFNLEEAGMKYMVQWLPKVIGSEIPVFYIQSGDAFQYIVSS